MTQNREIDPSRRDFLLKTAVLGTGLVFGSQFEKTGSATPLPLNTSPSAGKVSPWPKSSHGSELISPTQIQKAVSDSIANVIAEGLDDVFARPFEIDMLAHSNDLRSALSEHVSDILYPLNFEAAQFKPIETILMPKRRLLKFRKCARIDPVDATAYLALALLTARQIENQRPPQDRNMVFSYRFNPDSGHLFSRQHTYRSFIKDANRRLRGPRVKVLVECDIQGFYDNINLKSLKTRLEECFVSEAVADYIQDLLMYWSNERGYGLPVGPNASRVLAEAVLIPIDNYLITRGIEFIRYVDDYRLFAPDTRTANKYFTTLLEVLSQYGFNANPAKTRMIDVNDLPTGQNKTQWAQNNTDSASTDEQQHLRPGTVRRRQKASDSAPEPDALEDEYSETLPDEAEPIDENESSRLQNLDLRELRNAIESTNLPKVKIMKDFIRASVFRGRDRYVLRIPEMVVRLPQLAGFSVGTFIQNRKKLTPDLQQTISKRMAKILLDENQTPAYAAVQILRLLGSPGFQNLKALKGYFRRLRRDLDTYRGRATLDALTACRARLDNSTAAKCYAAADQWGKRSILNLIHNPRGSARFNDIYQEATIDSRSDPFIANLTQRTESNRA